MTKTENELLADVLDCFWNAAIGSARDSQDSTAIAVSGALAEGFAAMASRLRTEQPASPASEAGEPVAWQWRYRLLGTDNWFDWQAGRKPDFRGDTYEAEERPLYAHPPANRPSSESDAGAELGALRRNVYRLQLGGKRLCDALRTIAGGCDNPRDIARGALNRKAGDPDFTSEGEEQPQGATDARLELLREAKRLIQKRGAARDFSSQMLDWVNDALAKLEQGGAGDAV